MPDVPLSARERAVLQRITVLGATRAERDKAWADHRAAEEQAAEKDLRDAAKKIETSHAKSVDAAERAHAAALDEARQSGLEAIDTARRRMDRELAAYALETNALINSTNTQLEEGQWLAETMVESGEKKAKEEWNAAHAAIRSKQAELARIQADADTALAKRGHKPLDINPGEWAAPDPANAFGAMDTAIAHGQQTLAQLAVRLKPKFALGTLITLAPSLAGALAGYVVGKGDPKPLALGAGVGLGLGLVIILVLHAMARAKVKPIARALTEVLAKGLAAKDAACAQADADKAKRSADAKQRSINEIARLRELKSTLAAKVKQRREVEGPRLRERHQVIIADFERTHDERLRAMHESHQQRLSSLTSQRDRDLAAAQSARDQRLTALSDTEARERRDLDLATDQSLAATHAELRAITQAPEVTPPVWLSSTALNFPSLVPNAIRLGSLRVDPATLPGDLVSRGLAPFELPILLDLYSKGSLLALAPAEARSNSIKLLQSAMLRILTDFPAGKARFTIIDPVGLGQSFASFMHLADHDPALVSDRIWTDPKHVEQKLTDLTEHMENVIQKYLRNEYASIQEYNEKAGELAEPFRFLVLADFPANVNEQAAKRLASIISSGPRCGVFTLIAADAKQKLPNYIPIADIERHSNVYLWKDNGFTLKDDDFARWPLTLDALPEEPRLIDIVKSIGVAAKDSSRVQVPFDTVAPPRGQEWSIESADDVHVALGRSGANKIQHITLGPGTAQHALIAGRTGSGKSTLLHVLITNAAMWYSPDELELYLVDFKKGVEFKAYATHNLPHARVIAIESEREFGISVLRRLDAELTRRGSLFRDVGVQNMPGFRKSQAQGGLAADAGPVPRTLLIVDEFQEFFVEDDKVSQEAALLLDRLVRQGRAFGIHVILGSQTLAGAFSIARSTIGQMAVRVALQCSEGDAYLIMGEDNTAPRLLSRPGEAIYNDQSGMIEGNSPFQVVWLSEEKRDDALKLIAAKAKASDAQLPPKAIVFEGNIPGDVAANPMLAAILDRSALPPAEPRLWLGDPISIKDPTAAVLRRQSGGNVLIIGQNEESALSMLATSALSLAAHHAALAQDASPDSADAPDSTIATTPAKLVILDSGDEHGERTQVFQRLAHVANPEASLSTRVATPRETATVLSEFAQELARREAAAAGDASHGSAPIAASTTAPMYLFIHALHKFRDLRRGDEFDFGSSEKPETPAQQFAKLLREGPSLNMHVVAWCDTAANLERSVERRTMREFETRVLFQMSATDSSYLIESPAASQLGRHRALLFREEMGTQEKFRPYAMPRPEWWDVVEAKIRAGGRV
jgi:S-DNA-T family DNA segregation ATPase FtsK/SpoIIIE